VIDFYFLFFAKTARFFYYAIRMDIKTVEQNVENAATLLKALSNDRRLLIVCVLHSGEKCVGDLEDIVGLSQSALSQHLARLRRDEIVQTRRDAQTIYYSLKDKAAEKILTCLNEIYGSKSGADA
jgi:ArsR family transcriptional regulator, virulence genes transcriptional regulator